MSGSVSFLVQTAGDQTSTEQTAGDLTSTEQTAGDQTSNDQMCSESNGLKPGDLIHIHIKNITQTEALKKVLGTANGHKVILEDLKEDKKEEQLWKIGVNDNDCYFTLENSKVSEFLTATSSSSLEIKGKVSLRWIPNWLTNTKAI